MNCWKVGLESARPLATAGLPSVFPAAGDGLVGAEIDDAPVPSLVVVRRPFDKQAVSAATAGTLRVSTDREGNLPVASFRHRSKPGDRG